MKGKKAEQKVELRGSKDFLVSDNTNANLFQHVVNLFSLEFSREKFS